MVKMSKTKEILTWEHLDKATAESHWDSNLVTLDQYSVFQGFAWGEYKRISGWHVDRWIIRQNQSPVAVLQTVSKRLPGGIYLVWVPGGPLLREKEFENGKLVLLLKEMVKEISEQLGERLYIRLNMTSHSSCEMTYQLNQYFKRAIWPINSGYSYSVEIQDNNDNLISHLSRKHRYYARRALDTSIKWHEGNGEKERRDFISVHKQMTSSKKLEGLALVKDELDLLVRCFSEDANIITGYLDSIPVTTCLVLTLGHSAFYYLAATNEHGRELSAAYGLVFRAMEILSRKGIKYLDMGGIDPRGAPGITHFKKGFGGQMIEYLGEWDWANSEWLRWAANCLIAFKMRRM
jgi:lipid II:glycine glycyltransferase (peptidoglycan interpeptide bridge formation enzyme)